MKNQYPVIINENSVSIFKGANRLVAHVGHPMFNKIVKRIRENNFNGIEQMFKIKDTFERLFNVTVKNNSEVFYKGKKIHNVLTDKIINAMRTEQPYRGWVCFLDKLMENPNDRCRDQLFSYVENYGLPIDNDGFVYAWKAIRNDYWDKWTGKTHCYKVGSIASMKRENCDLDATVACGRGLHSGNFEYVKGYGSGDDRYVLIRFSPKDVVSCPSDCSWKKLRCCKLRVMKEVKREDMYPLDDKYMGKNQEAKVKARARNKARKLDTRKNYSRQQRDENGRFVSV